MIISLLTDFGTADGYVGEMKGVLLSFAPTAVIVDIAHDIAPQDTEGARLTLARFWRRFPPGTVHVVVVDPGVGTERGALAVQSDLRFLVGPDTGVLSPALVTAGARAVRLPVTAAASPTFHGRDVFSPAAARLALGESLDSLGEVVTEPVIKRTPEPHRRADGAIEGCILSIDRFGNAITNLVGWRDGVLVVAGTELPLKRTYADVDVGASLALVGSSGLIEIAVRDGNAAKSLNLSRGLLVVLRV